MFASVLVLSGKSLPQPANQRPWEGGSWGKNLSLILLIHDEEAARAVGVDPEQRRFLLRIFRQPHRIRGVLHRLPVDLEDDVAGFEASFTGRRSVVHARDQRALDRVRDV